MYRGGYPLPIDGSFIHRPEDFKNIDIRSGWVEFHNPSQYLQALGLQQGTRIHFGFEEESGAGDYPNLYDYTQPVPEGVDIVANWGGLNRHFMFQNLMADQDSDEGRAHLSDTLKEIMDTVAEERFAGGGSRAKSVRSALFQPLT